MAEGSRHAASLRGPALAMSLSDKKLKSEHRLPQHRPLEIHAQIEHGDSHEHGQLNFA